MDIYLSPLAKAMLRAAAIDCYPREASGWLLGTEENGSVHVFAPLPIAQADFRRLYRNGECAVSIETSTDLIAPEIAHYVVGGFHSHPDDKTVCFSEADKEACSDLEIVVAVTLGARGQWRIRMGAYHEPDSGIWRRARLVVD